MKSCFVGAAVLVCALAGVGRADVTLFTQTISGGGGSSGDFTDTIYPEFNYYQDSPFPRLFRNTTGWTTADVGTTRTITSASDSAFNDFTTLLTNGTSQDLAFVNMFSYSGGGGVGNNKPEAWMLYNNDFDPRIDLHGKQVNTYSLRLDALTITHPGGTGTNLSYQWTWSATGLVPEPSSAAIICGAAAVAIARRSRRAS